jgi:hypothetical protein
MKKDNKEIDHGEIPILGIEEKNGDQSLSLAFLQPLCAHHSFRSAFNPVPRRKT